MATLMTREQAAAAVAAATGERDGIQANLLLLDGSFGKRMLAGAALTGESQRRWEAATADLATLWETFTAYAAVVDKAAELLAGARRSSERELAQITTLLTGASVEVTRSVPLTRRDLTETGRSRLTLAAAVREMRRAFAGVSDVVAAAESVWNETADGLGEIGAELDAAKKQLGDTGDDEAAGALAAAGDELGRLRDLLNTDPLALWQAGSVDTARLGRLRKQVTAAAARAAEIGRVRADAQRRISAAAAAVSAAAAAFADAVAARDADHRRRAAATAGRDRGSGRAAGRAGQAQGRGTVGPAGGRAGHHPGRGGRGGAAVRGCAAGGGGAPGQARRAARPARRLPDQGGPAGRRRGQRTHQAL
jgi:hypothetical protein